VEFASRVLAEASKTGIGVTYRGAQLNGLESSAGKLLDRAGKVLGDHLADRPGLAPNRHAQRIGAQLESTGREKACRRCIGRCAPKKISSRNPRHDLSWLA